jgi:hypothetical protein
MTSGWQAWNKVRPKLHERGFPSPNERRWHEVTDEGRTELKQSNLARFDFCFSINFRPALSVRVERSAAKSKHR